MITMMQVRPANYQSVMHSVYCRCSIVSPAILYFIIGLVAITSIVQNVNALPQFVNNKHIPPAGASVTYTFENQRTGKTYTVPYFVSSEMKQIRIDLPAEFKSGDIVNGTMVEDFPDYRILASWWCRRRDFL